MSQPFPDLKKGIINAVFQVTSDPLVRRAMLMGAQMESGMDPNSVGDQGTSYGAWQIHLPAHPEATVAKAEDPIWAANFMLPAYQKGVSEVSSGLWNQDPGMAAATAAFYAERPAKMYATSTVRSSWPIVQAAINLGSTPDLLPPPPGGTTPGQPAGSDLPGWAQIIMNAFGPFLEFFANAAKILGWIVTHLFLPKTWARVAAFIVGSILLLTGLWIFFVGSSPVSKVVGKK